MESRQLDNLPPARGLGLASLLAPGKRFATFRHAACGQVGQICKSTKNRTLNTDWTLRQAKQLVC